LDRFAGALEATLSALAARGPAAVDVEDARTETAEQLMDRYLFTELLGMDEEAEETDVQLQAPAASGLADLPAGTLDVAVLRTGTAGPLCDRSPSTELVGKDEEAEESAVPLQDPAASGLPDLPAGTLAVADLRSAPLGARVDLMEVDVPGDPLEMHLAWREHGLVIALLGG